MTVQPAREPTAVAADVDVSVGLRDRSAPELEGPLCRPCCCGGWIATRSLRPDDVMAAVQLHRQSLLHLLWRWHEGVLG
jgi:hypothetical protein